ncbi:NUDIX hydrolase [Frankia sp. CcI156]|jgi:8-oxo-dGTP pyrophosphatase MutT (NUDIX family)|uniref:NUDIX hydrolase n=1 Tax=Frankia casuarinae (strain DSM 45818 / CECT 9043 / HFP020203 / CcI3) TaxID=106370 RepID=Q2J6N9_FRACC|nr:MULTISPECIES: NUDIX hydrolase [Frankia]ABD13053.1 NUDIX hydrolase [Frankia casuarinae]ETA01768.1 ADP-ribose pyrophosphatase [Frankia sp. CcI6]EYT92438.1 ADP-ribose pyrophosphatase [Frankia casuarinae]KFB04097.1 ADP-ribose pyrophosphatase [Frankia sp. Allo2]OAA23950.1 ADP-ribose pyrophosphatase [Frankia casuarinae]
MHSVSVAGVTLNEKGLILCIRRRDIGAWQIPGGVLERGETLHTGLRREVEEETGAVVEPVRLTGVYLNMPLGVVAMVFLCHHPTGVIASDTAEATEVSWLSIDEVRTRFVPAFAIRVADAVAGRLEPFIRTHDGVSVLPSDAAE